jgi:hypothetical protein
MSTKAKKEGSGVESRRTAFLSALVGGTCLIIAGASGGVGIYAMAATQLQSLYPQYPMLATIVGIVLPALSFIASLGGIAVIIGGILILGVRLTTGKFLIMIGAGVGIFGIILGLASGLISGLTLAQSAQAVFATYQIVGWIGIIFSIIARMMAKK